MKSIFVLGEDHFFCIAMQFRGTETIIAPCSDLRREECYAIAMQFHQLNCESVAAQLRSHR